MDGQDNRLKLEQYLKGKLDAAQEYALRHEDVVIDMPQSGERIRGRDNMKAMQDAYPGPPKVTVRGINGCPNLLTNPDKRRSRRPDPVRRPQRSCYIPGR